MVHRGRTHPSKTRHCVYCSKCECGAQYVGETSRNLKVRLKEHMQLNKLNSLSALTQHLKDTGHEAQMKDTVVLACEQNSLKRKVLESLVIEHKAARLTNTGTSIDIPAVWNTCARGLALDIADID